MKAVHFSDFTGTAIEFRDVPEPSGPNAGQVLVRVKAAGVNRADLIQAAGKYPPPEGYSPYIPGLEFAGEVAACGSSADAWRIGDRVFGIVAGEAQAEYVLTNTSVIERIPDRLSFTQAAAVPEAFITAHDAVFTQARLTAGETLLIHAVGSGVGLAALQMAKAAGIKVVGTSRTAEKTDRCLDLGLDSAIVATEPAFADKVLAATDGRGADVILDLVGGAYFAENVRSLAHKGRLMLVGLTSGRRSEIDLGMLLTKRAAVIGTTLRARSMAEKAAATRAFASQFIPKIASGEITPVIDRIFPAAEVREAYRYLASNKSFGKVILEF
ncbi:MAG: NAD(P)H-quinone oxidoreductase [Chloracidobacterium sp.]|nr:NAD(P)H-quinone oxidoreductase [Chloracidobacterium sp.]